MQRILIALSRSIIFILLIIAIASPFTLNERVVEGDPSVMILVDNSTSFSIFDNSIVNELKSSLEKEIPTQLKYICFGDHSPIGDSILNNMKGNDNLLLISDGNNNKGSSLGNVMMLASSLNTTISSVNLEPIKSDLAVIIDAPDEVIYGNNAEIYIDIRHTGPSKLNYNIEVSLDDNLLIEESVSEEKTFEIKEKLNTGYHKIKASITANDHFTENNVYYKTIHVLPKPKVLFISQKDARITDIFDALYDVEKKSYVPDNLNPYSAVIIYNIENSWIQEKNELLSNYVIDGNGLVVIGGDNSFDYGDYEDSIFETILPVKVGLAEKQEESGMNVVIILDVSGSVDYKFGSGSLNSKLDVEKAVATQVINGLRQDDRVAVLTFDFNSYLISPLLLVSEKPDLNYIISTIKGGGYNAGTFASSGLVRAEQILRSAKGSKNVIIISDGITQYSEDAISRARIMKSQGIKTYAVGVGFDTNSAFMQSLALAGGGSYFEPTEAQKINIIFNREYEDEEKDKMGLILIDTNHFITQNLELNARVTGYNQVVPKSSARMLVSTYNTNPIATVWRFGLGRVAALTTNPQNWAGDLLGRENSKLITRTVNWAIGDPNRKEQFSVKLKDSRLDDTAEIFVSSATEPYLSGFVFSKVDENLYKTTFVPKKLGFNDFFDASMAVNYKLEYQELGINPELINLVSITNGRMFSAKNTSLIVDFIKEKSKRTKVDKKNYGWIFMLCALLLFLIEVCARRIAENRKSI
ncbi:MAG: VWA domain-containing protein [Candidatus Nanoarchaeia archaeon]|nr:VWA domain-containing protein [Candidatus Nanoarchaeia archaeon]